MICLSINIINSMIHLSNITLSNINIYTKLSDTDQISSYVESVSSDLINKSSDYLSKAKGRTISANANYHLITI